MIPESQASTATFRRLKKLKTEDDGDDSNGGKLSVKLEKQSKKKITFGADIVEEIVQYKKDVKFFDDEDDFIDEDDDDEDEDDAKSIEGRGIASARSRRTTTAKKKNVISSDEDVYESDDSFEPDFI